MLHPLRNAISAVLLVSATALHVFGQGANSSGTIVGRVRVQRGGPPDERIFVTLETRGMPVNRAFTDNEGTFSFQQLPANPYNVIINEPRYERVAVTLAVNPATQQFYILSIELIPKRKASNQSDKQEFEGKNPNLIDAEFLRKNFPKEAVKAYESGLKALTQGKLEAAQSKFEKAIEIAPQFYPARNNLGMLYLQKSAFAQAEQQFQEVIRVQQADANAYFNLGNVYLLTDRPAESLRTVQEGLKREPDSAFGLFILGSTYARMGNAIEAEKQLQKALTADASMSKVHLELANLYMHQGRIENAKAELSKFLKAFPQDPLAPAARKVLEKLNKS